MAADEESTGVGEDKVHFVVRHQRRLYIVRDIFVYDPHRAGLTENEKLAIDYLEERLGSGEVAVVPNSVIHRGSHCVNAVMAPGSDPDKG